MFIPNTVCHLLKRIGYDAYGSPKFGKPILTRCAIVKLISDNKRTTVRSDVGASKSHATEDVINARLLFLPTCTVDKDDKVEIMGYTLQIVSKHPRLNIYGKLDHFECDGIIL